MLDLEQLFAEECNEKTLSQTPRQAQIIYDAPEVFQLSPKSHRIKNSFIFCHYVNHLGIVIAFACEVECCGVTNVFVCAF